MYLDRCILLIQSRLRLTEAKSMLFSRWNRKEPLHRLKRSDLTLRWDRKRILTRLPSRTIETFWVWPSAKLEHLEVCLFVAIGLLTIRCGCHQPH